MKYPLYVFDLDGVITNPLITEVDRSAVEHIYQLLEKQVYVAVNTGRSYKWVKDNLLGLLEVMGSHTFFDHLYIVCEKGGESLMWDGSSFSQQPSRFALPKEESELCKRVFEDNASELTAMFWDKTKVTMATIEKYPEADINEFTRQQKVLLNKLTEAFDGHTVKIDPTVSATDVELPGAGKHAGAELIYEWTKQHSDVDRAEFICLGDSKGDYEMARYFASQGNITTFVFVGNKDQMFDEHDSVTLVRPEALYAEGAREYLGG